MLENDGDHVRVVVSDGHMEGGLHSHARGVIRESLLGLQVGVGPLLKQLCRQVGQATAARCVKWTLTLQPPQYLVIYLKKPLIITYNWTYNGCMDVFLRTSFSIRLCAVAAKKQKKQNNIIPTPSVCFRALQLL